MLPRTLAVSGLALAAASLLAQPTSNGPLAPPPNGPRRADPNWVALTNCTLHPRPGQTIAGATVVARDGFITAVLAPDPGPDARPGTPDDSPPRIPLGPRTIDCTGLHVYAAFIDPYVEIDAPAPQESDTQRHWNPKVTPHRSALDAPAIPADLADSLRKQGFAAACISPRGGIFRGTSAVVSLARPADDPASVKPPVYAAHCYQSVGFELGGGYPSSEMGAIALIRQTLSDADWQASLVASGQYSGPANALMALAPTRAPAGGTAVSTSSPAPAGPGGTGAPPGQSHTSASPGLLASPDPAPSLRSAAASTLLFDCADELQALRAARIAREFHRDAMILGSGVEFRRLDAIHADSLPFLLPLNFPRAPDVSTIARQDAVELREMMTWEQAPTNPRRLAAAGVTFAFTTARLRDRAEFLKNLRTAVKHGLTPDQALAALTTTPASLLGLADLGAVETGRRANLLIADGDLFAAKNADKVKIRTLVIDGTPHEINPPPADLEGTWDVDLPGAAPAKRKLVVGSGNDIALHRDDKNVKCSKVSVSRSLLSFVFDHEPLDGQQGVFAMSGMIARDAAGKPVSITGQGVRPGGERFTWSATRRPPSLEGFWPVVFDDPGHPAIVLVFDPDNKLSFLDPMPGPDGLPIVPEVASWDGRRILTRGGGASGQAAVDFTSDPPTMTGSITTPEGHTLPFTAKRSRDNPFLGKWRVTRADDKEFARDARQQLFIEIKKSGKDHAVSLTFTGRKPAPARAAEQPSEEIAGENPAPEQGRPAADQPRRARGSAPSATAEPESFTIECTDVALSGTTLTFKHSLARLGLEGESSDTVRFIVDRLEGVGTLPDGSTHAYTARKDPPSDDDDSEGIADIPEQLALPFGPYQLDHAPPQETLLITNATLWTCADKGNIERGWLLVRDGKIAALGSGDATIPLRRDESHAVIDAAGKHLTPGIIDCHSHTGISRGVNEGGQAVTAEVRIQDVLNPDSVDWYRQLASGVTAVNQLHGSANAIGGQSQTTKIRWGVPRPDDMHFEGAIPGIKFALGENPTQANGSRDRTRYPVTRMGVEKLIRDRFTAAKEYAAAMKEERGEIDHDKPLAYPKGQPLAGLPRSYPPPPRRDLELEALAEVLDGSRLVHCHSYRQDEILMLCDVARDFGFKVGTFQHILEGYKVADYVRDWSGGGSGFADWWAYKVEVQDAIPHGLPLMHEVGAVTSFNSDSNELVRRLNVEAAKAVKYGNQFGHVSEQEALAFVTLNPAKQLRIDSRVGSLEVGKDADLALWSGHPLSTYSRCEMTLVDGRRYFSLDDDARHRETITKERQRLIQKLLSDGKKKPRADDAAPTDADRPAGPPGDRPRGPRRRPPSEDAIGGLSDEQRDALQRIYLDALSSGRDPLHMPGVCGCYW